MIRSRSLTTLIVFTISVALPLSIAGANPLHRSCVKQSAGSDSRSFAEHDIKVKTTGAILAATVFLPVGKELMPGLVITHGSEKAHRKNKFYRAFARFLAERGIASIIYDKRGVGDSTGEYQELPDLNLLSDDVINCKNALAQEPTVDAKEIGVWGISQGGWVANLAASKSDLAFIITISGAAVSPRDQKEFALQEQWKSKGYQKDRIDALTALYRMQTDYLISRKGYEELATAWMSAEKSNVLQDGDLDIPLVPPAYLDDPRLADSPNLAFDPAPSMRLVKVPVLALYGALDNLVPVQSSIDLLRKYYKDAGNQRVTVRIYDGVGHGVTLTPDGDPRFADTTFPDIVKWIRTVAKPAPR